MAIHFARPRFIQRSKGHNVVQVAGYNMRASLYCEMTGQQTPRARDPSTHIYHEIYLPQGPNTRFAEAGALWNAFQAAEHRKDSQEAFELVLPLPTDPEITSDDRIELARTFAWTHFVSKGLAVQIDIHLPHRTTHTEWENMFEGVPKNQHAHLLVTTRRLVGDQISSHKAADLQPKVRRLPFGKPIVAEGELWGSAWAQHQNTYFSQHGKGIAVDPVSPIPQKHIGPVRFRAPNDHRIAANEAVRQLNAKIARDPQAVAEHMRKQAQPFDGRALDKFLTKHLSPDERESVAAEVRTRLHNFQREALHKAAWSDKTGINSPQTVEYVARQLSPKYDDLLKRAAAAREDAAQVEWARNRQDIEREAAVYRVAERQGEMGIMRRVAHAVGTKMPALAILQDLELKRWTDAKRKGIYLVDNKSIRLGTHTDAAKSLLAEAAEVLNKKLDGTDLTLRQVAEIELIKRQQTARNARERLDTLRRDDRVKLRVRRSQSRGPSL